MDSLNIANGCRKFDWQSIHLYDYIRYKYACIRTLLLSGPVGISADIGILNGILILFRSIHLFKD